MDTTATLAKAPRPLNPKLAAGHADFRIVAAKIQEAGLLKKRPIFYVLLLSGLALVLAATITGVVLLSASWWSLVLAAVLGVVFAQFAFVSHEASHRAVFTSGKANDRLGRLLASGVIGMSHQWWMSKHSRHHANPNKIDADPDIAADTISFLEADARKSRGFVRWITKRQGWLFFPLLLLEGLNLHVKSIRDLCRPGKVEGRWIELSLIAARFAIVLGVIFWLLPVGMGFAFFGVQLGVFGVCMGASFAPNHKGMPIVGKDERLDFFSKQVRTSRNIKGWYSTAFMGGLNFQIEHHLFPSMPRLHLAKAARIVKAHCESKGVAYTEAGLFESYGIVVRYLNRVGLAARDPFDCPMLQLRG